MNDQEETNPITIAMELHIEIISQMRKRFDEEEERLCKGIEAKINDPEFFAKLIQKRIDKLWDEHALPQHKKSEALLEEHNARHDAQDLQSKQHHEMLIGMLQTFIDITTKDS